MNKSRTEKMRFKARKKLYRGFDTKNSNKSNYICNNVLENISKKSELFFEQMINKFRFVIIANRLLKNTHSYIKW